MLEKIKNVFKTKAPKATEIKTAVANPIPKSQYSFVEQYIIADPNKLMHGGYELWSFCEFTPVAYEEKDANEAEQEDVEKGTKNKAEEWEEGEKRFKLVKIMDEQRNINVESSVIDLNTGKELTKKYETTGEETVVKEHDVSAYGLATVMSYKEKERIRNLDYTYIGENVWGEDGLIEKQAYDEPNSKILSSFARNNEPQSILKEKKTEHTFTHQLYYNALSINIKIPM